MDMPEFIVVGSGCTGAMAAQTLVEAGRDVLMLDVGLQDNNKLTIPKKDFITIRRTEEEQYRYFIGGKAENASWGKVGKIEQLTPPRQHMTKGVPKFLPVVSDSFSIVESLGYGGLGIGWGEGCWEWSDAELKAAGLDVRNMHAAYNEVSARIGISATADSAAAYTLNKLKNFQKSPDLDRNHQLIYERYLKKESTLRKKGFVMGRAPLSVLTEDKDGRKKYAYRDMDYYSDTDRSAYRPWMTVDELKRSPHFTYQAKQLVTAFEEHDGYVLVHTLHTETKKTSTLRAKKLVLAAGVFGTARIVLRSAQTAHVRLPLLCNPYSYVPCLMLSGIGQEAERHKLGFAQLSLFLDEKGKNFGAAMASLYSYQSLMLFRMVRQVPFNFKDARAVMRYLSSGLVIMGIHQPDSPSDDKYVSLVPDLASPTGDALQVVYGLNKQEKKQRTRREKKYVRAMRSLGVHALKRFDPGAGSSIHYAGVLPFSQTERPFTLSPTGRLHGKSYVFVADGSGFTYLPAKGLTFSLMANAHNVAKEALRS